jgi:transcriptional regulator of acetoin/glycerol metabolism
VIERACLLSDGKMLSERDVVAAMPQALDRRSSPLLTESRPPPVTPACVTSARLSSVCPPASASALDPQCLSHARRMRVEHALREARGNKAAAARLMGISRRSIYRWLERLALSEPADPAKAP